MHYTRYYHTSRAFTGAWIETSGNGFVPSTLLVAPLRARGLKQEKDSDAVLDLPSRLYGRVD